ncbi:hypothetical protein [Flagellimonas hadalis]|uniref:Uncharacterized protein n=1 Tax=Flagellimonas hadalis TaxID=2597517 RepID=A0A5N5J071_9FLAO|nr:hypothetical protein [Allomuricauda hadalis]KAB5491746.1 hypothetical protein FOT42_001995 [Allomuricauda hadalis]
MRKDLDFTKVRYYTLKFEDDIQELQKFYDKYQPGHSKSINYIKMWLAEIGEKYGAESRFFRPEDNAKALPPPTTLIRSIDKQIDEENMHLRLYCILLSPEIVILVNGGVKESDATRDSPSCWKEFQFASNIASQIQKMLSDGHLQIKGKMLKRSKSFKLTYKK